MPTPTWRVVLLLSGAAAASSDLSAKEEDQRPDISVARVEQLIYEGHYAEAEEVAREILPEIENLSGSASLESAEVLHLLAEALWRGGKSNLPGSIEIANRALLIRESRLGRESVLFSDSLVRKAEILTAADEHTEAERLLVWALRIYEESEPLDGPRLVRAHDRLGRLYRITWCLPEAEWHSVLALEIARSLPDRDELLLAETLYGLALYLHREFSHSQRTEPMIRQVLSVRTEMLGQGHPLVAEASFLLGEILADGPRTREALDLHIQSLESMRRSLGPHHPEVAWCLYHLGTLLWSIGDPVAAEEALMRSVEGYSRYPELVRSAKPYNALGWFRQVAGDLVSARMYKEQALGIVERAFGYDSAESGAILNNLGTVAYDLGDIEEAKQFFERGLQVATESHGMGSEATAIFIMNLAEVHLALGDLEAAEELARRAWVIDDRVSRAVIAARVLARVLRTRGKFQEAENFLGKAFAGHRAEGDSRNWVAVENHVEYGHLMVDMGSCDKAIPQYREALSILEDQSRDRGPQTAAIRTEISDCFLGMGELEAALNQASLAERVSRDHLSLMLTGMSERVGLRYAASRPRSLDRMISMLSDGREPSAVREGVDAVIRSRALVVDEMANRRRMLMDESSPRIGELVGKLTETRKRLAYLAIRGPAGEEPESIARYKEALAEATLDRDRIERRLAEASRAYRLAQQGRRAGLQEVEAALPSKSALLGYKRFQAYAAGGYVEIPESSPESNRPDSAYAAFVVRTEGSGVELIDLGSAEEIDVLIEEVREKILVEAESTLGSSEMRELAFRKAAERLRMRIWDPVKPYLGDADSLFVIPDGTLNLVNLSALPHDSGGYLADSGLRVHYLSAERDLIRGSNRGSGQGLLAMGNPDFDSQGLLAAFGGQEGDRIAGLPPVEGQQPVYRGPRSSCESYQSMKFEPLPASELEVVNVARTWSESHSSSSALRLTGEEAGETSFKRLAGGRRVVHLATHGFYLGEDCPAHTFEDASGEERVRFEALENPLLRTGLVFAGANHRQAASPEEDDGILTAEEVAATDLPGVDWAVLSACESGLGDVQSGEGIFGLRRAFQIAGAQTLIMSLWPVDDDATRDWMQSLYHHRFAEGASTIDAVHHANLDLLTTRRAAGLSTHPFYWAGFVAAGDWQ